MSEVIHWANDTLGNKVLECVQMLNKIAVVVTAEASVSLCQFLHYRFLSMA